MKKFIIGNWKSNKNEKEMVSFFNQLAENLKQTSIDLLDKVEVVICPAFLHLAQSRYFIQSLKLPISLGAQDISPFSPGSFTGEIYAGQLKDYAAYCIIGHSERRKYFAETDDILKLKVQEAKKAGLQVIYCVPDSKTLIPESIDIAAYEPVFAIGTGNPDTPENANRVSSEIKITHPNIPVIYGGSVNADNIKSFLQIGQIDGVLPGKASLNAEHFHKMILNAAS